MIHDTKNLKVEDEVQGITEGNNPNDDEEILNNSDEPGNVTTDKTEEREPDKQTDKSEGSETIGIP